MTFFQQVVRQSKCGAPFFVQWMCRDQGFSLSAYAKLRTISVIPADEHNNNCETTYITFSGFIVYPKDCVKKRNFVVSVNNMATLAPTTASKLSKVYAVMDEYVKKREADAYTYCSPLSSRASSLSSPLPHSIASSRGFSPGLTEEDIPDVIQVSSPASSQISETEKTLTPQDVEALREAVGEDKILQQRILEEYPVTVTGSSFSSGFEHEMAKDAELCQREQEVADQHLL